MALLNVFAVMRNNVSILYDATLYDLYVPSDSHYVHYRTRIPSFNNISPGLYHLDIRPLEEVGVPHDTLISLTLPVLMNPGVRGNHLLYYPPVPDADQFSFSIAAENVFASTSVIGFQHDIGDSMWAGVSTMVEYCWWGSFVLPDTLTVKHLLAYDDFGGVDTLDNGEDWLQDDFGDKRFINVRIPFDVVRLTLVYQERPYICGDADASGIVDIDDVVYLIAYIFLGGPPPVPYEAGDADCSDVVDIDDVVWMISYIFSGGFDLCDIDGNGEPDC